MLGVGWGLLGGGALIAVLLEVCLWLAWCLRAWGFDGGLLVVCFRFAWYFLWGIALCVFFGSAWGLAWGFALDLLRVLLGVALGLGIKTGNWRGFHFKCPKLLRNHKK